MIVTQFLNNVI